MKCPKCGSEGAYVGLQIVECPNGNCENFTNRQLDVVESGEEECSSPESCCHDCAKCSEKDDVPF